MRLTYVGDGAWLPGVPASDHEVEDETRATELVASGLYERTGAAPRRKSAGNDTGAAEAASTTPGGE